jgi:Fic family protein
MTSYPALSGTTLERIQRRKSDWERVQPVPKQYSDVIYKKVLLEWTFNSNRIEGNEIGHGETRLLLRQNLTPGGKKPEHVRDILAHGRAVALVYDWVKRKEVLTETAVRDLHRVLMGETFVVEAVNELGQPISKRVEPGNYKDEPNYRTVNGTKQMYALPQDVVPQMYDLLSFYRGNQESIHPLVLVAIFHHRFTLIHPFPDGNGRLGRLLLNFQLMEQNYTPIIINNSEKDRYFAALRTADADNSAISPLAEFFAEAELASLDLHCRGAAGENIDEETDIDKRILLF